MLEFLQVISIFIEMIVVLFGVLIALRKKHVYGWLIALTFGIYVAYDTAKYLSMSVASDMLYAAFFIASLSILIAVYLIFVGKK